MKKIVTTTVIIWFAGWAVTWPALLADMNAFDGKYYRLDARVCKSYRSDLAMAMLFGLAPPMWVLAPFLTGFYEQGFQVFPHPRCLQAGPRSSY